MNYVFADSERYGKQLLIVENASAFQNIFQCVTYEKTISKIHQLSQTRRRPHGSGICRDACTYYCRVHHRHHGTWFQCSRHIPICEHESFIACCQLNISNSKLSIRFCRVISRPGCLFKISYDLNYLRALIFSNTAVSIRASPPAANTRNSSSF